MSKVILSPKDRKVLDFVREYIERCSYSPSYREISDACGNISLSMVQYRLNRLARAGYIERHDGVARGIVLVEQEESIAPELQQAA